MKRIIYTFLISVFVLPLSLFAQDEPVHPAIITTGTLIGVSPPLRDLPAMSEEEYQAMVEKAEKTELNEELKERLYPFASTAQPQGEDPAWQKEMGKVLNGKGMLLNFSGQSSPYMPSDCNGTAGPNHYMQTVNTTYAIYNKSGVLVAGPTNMNLLFGSVPGANRNDGDPIILYDEQADRWLAAEFSLDGTYGSTTDRMLIAVSKTNDPTGQWWQYSFDVDDMPDYEKFGIWRDGYYMGTNNSSGNDIYVFERSQMLIGGTAQMVGFNNPYRPNSGFHCVPPVDNDGTFAPAGTPGIFITINDDAWGGSSSDQLWIYQLSVDWTTPSNSTFNRTQTITVAAFDSNFGGGMDNIAQKGTSQKVDAIPQVLMQRPQYRNFGTYQTIVCCHTVDVDNTDHAGVRWYELRSTGGNWSVRQYGTYAPDGHSRWLGSIALNGSNEIALGYSISSSSMYPGIRYCGQSAATYNSASGLSSMDIAESVIQNGTQSQPVGTYNNRWGDYANMSIDPTDDHSFWFTTEYYNSGKKTKIAKFQFSSPSSPPVADFTANNLYPANSLTTVIFTDQSTNNPTSWSWTFVPNTVTYVGGTSSTSQNPQVRFNNFGAYTVALTATNAYGSNTNTKTDYIHVGQPGLWTGTTSTDWNTSTNWQNQEVPNSNFDVSITTAATNWPTKTGNLTVGTDCKSLNMGMGATELTVTGDLTIPAGTSFQVDPNGTATIKVGGNWTATGTFTPGQSTVEFYGTGNSTLGTSKKATDVIVTSLFEDFESGSLPSGWNSTNTNTSTWAVDASPNPPGSYSGSYSLNFNNGTNYDDGSATSGTVTTAAIDNSNATSTTISFYYQLETEGDATYDWVEIEILRASDNTVLQTIGGSGTSIQDKNSWTLYTINGNASVVAESSIKLRFTFTATDGLYNNYFGWFIDDLKVEKDVPITSITFNNLTINKSGGTVITNSGVDVQQTFTINPGAYFTNSAGNTFNVLGNALFRADATGTSSFIDNGTSFINSPVVESYISQDQWHIVSSPITNAQSSVFTGVYLKDYNEPTQTWSYIVPTNVNLPPGEGFMAWSSSSTTGNATVAYSGPLNIGDINVTGLSYTSTLPQADRGWNMVGNPYPSAVHWDNVWGLTNLDATIYVYDVGTTGNYLTYNTSGSGTHPTGDIAPGQGFWVKTNASGASLTIPQSERLHSSQQFYKNGTPDNQIFLTVEGNGFADKMIVNFNDEATEGFDNEFDAWKLKGDAAAPQLYSFTGGNEFTVNVLPFNKDMVIPVYFEAGTDGTFTITVTGLENFSLSQEIWLEDTKDNKAVDLMVNPSYTFTATVIDNSNRFLLHFANTLGVGEELSGTVSIHSYGNTVYVTRPADFTGNISIYDMLGQEIISQKANGEGLVTIPVTNGTGYYVVKVQSDNNLITRKVFIK